LSFEKGMNIIQKPIGFLREVKIELGKVSWSTRDELLGSTIVVIVITAIMTAFIFFIDSVLSKGLSIILK
jgi:preprotein translocase subunit SecE